MSEINLTQTFDARIWAKEWMRITSKNPNIATDEGTMLGWFSNALMAGYDRADRDWRRKINIKNKIVNQIEDVSNISIHIIPRVNIPNF
jgi:hypothetical protein